MPDLMICQECKKNPATYGDGLTWSRCSECQLKFNQAENKKAPESPETPKEVNTTFGKGEPHQLTPGLVSIILPVYMLNYTLFHYTGNAIGSIREHTQGKYELIVVDNGSPVQPPELDSYYADKVIKNTENLGVTKAWNQGIRASFGEYIVLINNDVQVFDNWLEDMKTGLEQFDLVMAHPMYSLTEPFARATESRIIRDKAITSKDYISDFKDFSCVMFKKSLLDEIGLFDEDFFSYCSDSDLFKRMEKAGKKWACLNVVPTSHISDATGYSIPETPEIMNKDKATYAEKWPEGEVVTQKLESDTPEETMHHDDTPKKELPEGVRLVRSKETGDMIFYIEKNNYHHVADPDTLAALGFAFGDEEYLDTFEFSKLNSGEEINMENVKTYAKT